MNEYDRAIEKHRLKQLDEITTEIENIIKEKEQKGELLCHKDKMTTPFVYELEKSIIENMNAGKNTLGPIYKKLPELQSQFPLKDKLPPHFLDLIILQN